MVRDHTTLPFVPHLDIMGHGTCCVAGVSLKSENYMIEISSLLTNLRKTLDWFKLTMRKKSNNRGKEASWAWIQSKYPR